ncbi:hypothetical protein PFICI_03982 [Pestalotiopsis fici W106-1]|uniref:Uncharacterized protein n=1 Tax=Pestalotiopsis fici (strain W106-1 / CGMCC3.15140) TaxID=1229662 RepID=W3XKG5_PESFW|nr:uncharacterized protein PFICI_03982 [Pestalotiopsis fici W106-1]ETS85957.1 hypothetical protein PFICI_03982 [Pestalotiopsis fici W106-1]
MSPLSTLGIDFGSTSTRAFLWCPEENKEYYIESTSKARNNHRFSAGDFSSVGYPFDDGEVYLGQKIDASRQSISLKYAFYVLANAPADLASQYQVSEPLRRRQREPDFLVRLQEGISQLFNTIYHRVVEVCREERLRVTTIGLSVPSQWTLDFMDLYRGIVSDAFRHDPKSIYFVTEVEALAHFLFARKVNRLIPLEDSVQNAIVVILDFGGHTMLLHKNTCTLKLVHDSNGLPAFYLIGEPEGVSGGSELWELLLVETSLEILQREHNIVPSGANRQKLLDSINNAKYELGPQYENKDFDHIVRDGKKDYMIGLDESCVTNCFDKALRKPLALAATRIRDAATTLKLDNQIDAPDIMLKPRVILSGGTASHQGLARMIEDICRRNGLDKHVATDDIRIHYDSVKIASGAAFAVASSLTVEKFLQRGAAFGLQMRQPVNPGSTESEHKWDNTAYFLWSLRKPNQPLDIFVTGRDELKIICDPFFEKEHGNQKKELHYDKCYDFVSLGRPTKGTWTFSLDLVGEDDKIRLIIRTSRQFGNSRPQSYEPVGLLLHYNRGSNSIHPGRESCDSTEDPDILALKYYPERVREQEQDTRDLVVPGTRRMVARRGRSRKMPRSTTFPDRVARRGARRC